MIIDKRGKESNDIKNERVRENENKRDIENKDKNDNDNTKK